MPAKELGFAATENIGRRGRRPHHAAEPVDPPAFKIHTAEDRFFYARLALFQELVGLLRVHDVAAEKNHAGGLNAGEQFGHWGRHFCAVEADNHQLADTGART